MDWMRKLAYPWPVSRKPRKNSAVGDAARNPGGIDAWVYPEDVPSDHMAQHPRRALVGRVALGLSIAAVMAIWAGVALSQTHDSAGRYILHGDVTARPA
ncbi:hypothetical protein GI582_26400, partial [Sulfitobacter sp. BDSS02]|nr:hypothetical protein [Sulfitobacter sp. BDSS02]